MKNYPFLKNTKSTLRTPSKHEFHYGLLSLSISTLNNWTIYYDYSRVPFTLSLFHCISLSIYTPIQCRRLWSVPRKVCVFFLLLVISLNLLEAIFIRKNFYLFSEKLIHQLKNSRVRVAKGCQEVTDTHSKP